MKKHQGRRRGERWRIVAARVLCIAALSIGAPLGAQYDKVAALGSDSSLAPIGGPASAPPLSIEGYDRRDFRPTGALNDRLPRWLQFGLDERFRGEGYSAGGFRPGNRDSYLLNRFRAGLLIQPVRGFKLVAQAQDARSFLQQGPAGPPNNVRWDLKLAYAQFGDLEKQPVSVSAGRLLIDFNNTLIGNSEWRNQARAYDGVVTQFRVERFRAAVFAASVVNPQLHGISHHKEGNNIYGVYGWMTRVVPESSIEPFTLWRLSPGVPVEGSKAQMGRLDEKAYGFRIRGGGIANWDYRYELVIERGHAGTNPVRAWATTAALGYTGISHAWKPRLFAGFDYASGDRNPGDGTRGTFDAIYPTAHDRFGITDQFGWQNIAAGRGGVTVIPHRRWSVTAQYVDLWLAAATDGAYNSSGGLIVRDISGRSGRHLGEEADCYTWYEINRQVHLGVGMGRLLAGEFLAKTGRGAAYTYPYFLLEMFDGKRIR